MSSRVVRALLRLAPRSFRDRYGEELLQVHEARRAGRGVFGRVRLAVREVAGLAAVVMRLRLAPESPREPRRRIGREWWPARAARDALFALRTLRRHPSFALASVSVLALAIGASTTIFSAANAFFFRPLPFADPERLVMLYETNPEFGWTHETAAPANFLDWRENVRAFEDVAAYSSFVNRVTYVQDGEPTLLAVSSVTGNFFDVLGVTPVLGRTFRWEETWTGADGVLVISHATWVSIFGADPGIVGRRLDLGARTAEVVGVLPAGFGFPDAEVQMWTPFGWDPAGVSAASFRRAHWLRPIGRLAPGVDPSQAEAQLQVEVARLQQAYPETNRVMGAGTMPLRTFLVREVRSVFLVLAGAAALLLLLGCVNVANLALVRGTARNREVALRQALGAGHGRVASLVAVESLTLAAVGGALGFGVGWLGLRAVERMTPLGIPGATAVALDHRVLFFTSAVTGLAALLFGLAPVLLALRGDVSEALRGSARAGSDAHPTHLASGRATRGFVALEVALAVLLVAGAGLMVRTYWHLRHLDPGFRTEGVLAVQLTIPAARYQNRDDVLAFQDRLLEALEGRAGIERAGTVVQLPFAGPSWSSQFKAQGWPAERVGSEILHRRADRGYFEALGVPLVRGRLFDANDRATSPFVVVINETFAREHFPGEDPIGQRIAYDRAPTESSTWYEIVGIVGDQGQVSPAVTPRAEVFENRSQDWARTSWIVLRTDGDPLDALPTVRAALRELDPLIPLGQARPLHEVWRASMAQEELVLVLLGAFGVLALTLASVGVYAVTAQAARRRTREIGIRVALGAMRGNVLGLVLRQSLSAVGIGLAVGVVATLLATRWLESLLSGVEPTDPLTLVTVVGLLLAVGGLACWLPAWSAARADPVASLKAD
jgi:putative ABC transport system permease protein